MSHALTIDVEDWANLICGYLGREIPVSAQFSSAIYRLLDLLDQHGARGTFFIVAPQALEGPEAVREIASHRPSSVRRLSRYCGRIAIAHIPMAFTRCPA